DMPSLAPWLARFVAASKPSRVEAGSRAMASLCDRMHADYAPLIAASGAQPIISDLDCTKLYRNRADWEAESRTWRLREKAGLQVQLLDTAMLHRLEPEMTDFAKFGVVLKGRNYIRNPLRLLQSFIALFQSKGGQVVRDEVA